MRFHPKFSIQFTVILTAMMILAACGLKIDKVPLGETMFPPDDAQPSPIALNKIRFAVKTGTPIIASAPTNLWDFLFNCDIPYGLRAQGSIRGRGFPSDGWREIFRDTLTAQGYDVAGDPGLMFDEGEDLMRATYSIGGRITDVKVNKCNESSWFGSIPRGESGEGLVTVEWSVFDLLHRKNVYKLQTQGYSRLKTPNYDGFLLLFEEALAAAIHNLGADEEFHRLVFYGEQPEDPPFTRHDPYEQPIGKFDPNEAVTIINPPVSTKLAKQRMKNVTAAAVMVQAGHSHASGFFITRQGHILTNAHAVGNASRVRVVSKGKKKKMIAEVLRVDRLRDVALLRLEEVPEKLKITTLPIQLTKPEIGADVYAIGAPALTRLQDTVTKGIVSAHRFEHRKRHWLIQADVYIYGGNSGGPLIDAHGNIVGIAVSGWVAGDQDLSGLNNFIPIADALKKLDIGLIKHGQERTADREPVKLSD